MERLLETPGCLNCVAGEVEYKVPDTDVFRLAFKDPSQSAGAFVESVQIGAINASDCRAQRYPAQSPAALQKSFVIAVNYSQCGFANSADNQQQTMTHSNGATIVLRLPSPIPSMIRRRTFSVDLHCIGSSTAEIAVPTQYFAQVDYVGQSIDTYGVTVRYDRSPATRGRLCVTLS